MASGVIRRQYAVGVDLVLEPFGEGLARVDG